MDIMIKKFIAQLSFWMLRILDGMMGIFSVFTGMDSVNYGNGEGTDILSYFLNHEKIRRAWTVILIASVAILGMFTIIAVIKTMANTKKSQGKVVGQFIAAIAAFFIAQFVVLAGIYVSNGILSLINSEIGQGGEPISRTIFDLAVGEEGYRPNGSADKFHATDTPDQVFGKYKENKLIGMEKDPGAYSLEVVPIYQKDAYGNNVLGSDGKPIQIGEQEIWHAPSGWDDTYISNSGGIADLYKTNLFILFFAPLILLIIIGISLVKLTRRIFNIILLYLCAPFFISSIPLDDGSRFKLWRENIISTTLSIYGTVVAFNVFLIVMGILGGMSYGGEGFWNTVFKLLLMIGAAMTAASASDLFASLMGGSPHQGGNLGQAIYSGMQGMAMGAAVGGGAMRLLTGRRKGGKGGGGSGGEGKGALGGILGAAKNAADYGGKLLGGHRYEGMKQNFAQKRENMRAVLRGKTWKPAADGKERDANKFMKNNGLLGAAFSKHTKKKQAANTQNNAGAGI